MSHWVILVNGYGSFLFEGTEAEAEEMRVHKARWERGIGKKREASPEEVKTGDVSQCWNHHGFQNQNPYGDCPCPDEDCVADACERLDAALTPTTQQGEQP